MWVLDTAVTWRRGGVSEAAAVAELMTRAFDPRFGEAWNEAQVAGAFATGGAWMDVALAGDAVVGFALARFLIDEAELLLCATEPAWRGRGLGAAGVAAVTREATMRGARRVFLEVREDNDAARRLYARRGFEVVGRRRGYYRGRDGVARDALTMALKLSR